MAKLFEGHPDALANVREIAERCSDAVAKTGGVHMPSVASKGGESAERRLVRLAVAGARRRYEREMMPEVKGRLRREISCIVSLGFANRLIKCATYSWAYYERAGSLQR